MKMSKLIRQMLGISVGIFIFIVISISIFFSWTLYTNIMLEYQNKGISVAQSIADSGVDLILNRDESTIQSLVNQYYKNINGVAYIAVRNSKRELISHTFVPYPPEELSEFHEPIINKRFSESMTIQFINVKNMGKVLDISAPILAGEVGFVHVGMDTRPILSVIYKTIGKTLLIILLIFIFSVIMNYIFMRRIAKPLQALTEYADKLAKHTFDAPLEIQKDIKLLVEVSKNEISNLANAFINLEDQLILYIKNLQETTSAKEKMESELNIARSIQMSMLPKLMKKIPGYEMYGYLSPAKEVGGDFYDYYLLKKRNSIYFAIGDVSGKGVPAALFMAMTMMLLNSLARQIDSPSAVITEVNRELCERNEHSLFVTLFFGVLDLRTGMIEYCNAGHLPPYLVSDKGQVEELALTDGMALGVDPDFEYETKTAELSKNTTVFVYSDGVTEAENSAREQFGHELLEKVLKDNSKLNPKDLCEKVFTDINSFAEEVPQFDDISILALRKNI
ncbi:SpoIIE family protein phosphatase [Candidatus Margulisiibacteriota bacterium]